MSCGLKLLRRKTVILYTNLKIKLLISFIIIFTTAFFLITNEQTIIAETEESIPPYKFEPSPDPKRILGIISVSGYTKQPNSNYYVTLGESLHIKTEVERTPWSNFLLASRYHWWQSTDGKTWTEVEKKFNGDSSLNLTPAKLGRIYYQLSTSYVVPFPYVVGSVFYSKVATVDVTPQPISAKKIKVHTKADYLFNVDSNITRSTTFAYSTPDPFNATESTKWSVDNPELATVNDDGHVFANTKGKSGIVKVIATINNKDSTVVSDSKEITIGNGLIDKAIPEGKKARFEIQGLKEDERDDESNDITINWYKQVNTKPKELVKSEKNPISSTFYETPRVHPEDNNSKYFAQIIVRQGNNNNSVFIGPAKLTVLPPNDPKVEISSAITNKTFGNDNTNTQLNEVTNGDQINYNIDLYNNSKRAIHNSYITLPLHLDTQIENIKINGVEIDNSDYFLTTNEEHQLLRVNLSNLDMHQEKSLFIATTAKNITDRESFNTQIDFYGLDPDSDEYTSQGDILNINYINNKLMASIKELNFEPITPFEHNKLKYRISNNNDPNEIISIDDQRRKRRPLKLYLKQVTNFMNKDNSSIELPASLRYYSGNSFKPLTDKVLISETKLGQLFHSIKWDKDQGPLLHLSDTNLTAGNYSSQIVWQFDDSI